MKNKIMNSLCYDQMAVVLGGEQHPSPGNGQDNTTKCLLMVASSGITGYFTGYAFGMGFLGSFGGMAAGAAAGCF